MPNERLEPGGRPPKHLLEPVKGSDGIYRIDRVRHRAFNGDYPRTSGSGFTRKECLADWERNYEKNRRKGSILDEFTGSELTLTDSMALAFEKTLEQTKERVKRGEITQQTYLIYRRAIRKSDGPRGKPDAIRLGPQMGSLSIAEAGRPSFLARYLASVAAIVPGIAHRQYVVLRLTFEMLTLAGVFDVSPMAPVPKPAGGKGNQKWLRPNQRDQLYDQICVRIKRAAYFRVMFLILLGTGIRPGEAFALWWEDILGLDDPDCDRAVMRVGTTAVRDEFGPVRQGKRKGGVEGRYYYLLLPRWLTAELRAWRAVCTPSSEQSPVLVNTMGNEVQAAGADANLVKARRDSSLDWVTFGNLRDTVATHVAGRTGDPSRASAQLGHAEGATVATRHYIDPDGFLQKLVDNADVLEELKPSNCGGKLE